MTELGTTTDEVLQAVAERLGALNEGTLQKEINDLHMENQELARQMQERQIALQLKQLDLQRRNEGVATGGASGPRRRGDREIQKTLETLHRAVSEISEQTIHEEINRLQQELSLLQRHIQERQHVLGLKQMFNQGSQAPAGVQFGLPLIQQGPGVSFQLGPMQVGGVPQAGGQEGPRVDADTKRRAILEIMREQPGRTFKPAEVRRALVQRGMVDPDQGTPVRSLLWKLHKDGHVDRPAPGSYSLPTVQSAMDKPEPEAAIGIAVADDSD